MTFVLGPGADAVGRWLGLTGTVLLVGVLLFIDYLAGDARERTEGRARTQLLAATAGLAVLTGAALRLVQQAAAFAESPAEWAAMVPTILSETVWGYGWLIQTLTGAFLLLTIGQRWGSRTARVARWLAVLGLAVAPSLSGHAIGSENLTLAAVVADAAHVVAAGLWIGGLAAMAIAWVSRGGEAGTAARLHVVLTRFSPIATGSVAILGLTGLFASWLHVPSVGLLGTTTYGRLLIVKVLIVIAVGALGAYHWRVTTPRLRTGRGASAARRSMALEAALGILVLFITAVLVSTQLPGD